MEIKEPSNYAEAVFLQHAKISTLMDKLCDQLAMCEINAHDPNVMEIFSRRLEGAVQRQEEKGDDALWYQVNFVADDEA